MKKNINKNLSLLYNKNYPYISKKNSLKKYIVYLGIGGNIGNVKKRFNLLFKMLKSNSKINIEQTSPILKNPPFGFLNQDDFLNAIIKVKTNLSYIEILRFCWYYENKFKRQRSFKDAPRTLDIDIIFIEYKSKKIKIKTKQLTTPHIGYKNRLSVQIPLKYIKGKIK